MKRTIITLLGFISFYLLFIKATYANGILLYEDFATSSDSSWSKVHEMGVDYSNNWHFLNGMYGNTISSSFSIENNINGSFDWTDYKIEFDMYPLEGSNKNFIFRYQQWPDPNMPHRWYELHIAQDKAYVNRAGVAHLAPGKTINITNGQIYNWIITAIGNYIKVEFKNTQESEFQTIFEGYDNLPQPILNGKIGLRVGTGVDTRARVYFDNIKVTDLSPKPLFTHFSQYDQQWANDTYDHASAWTSFPTIKNWGCALTSAAMILNHHGFTKGPSGQSTNPQTLNQYLTQVPGGYTPNGKIVWSAVTKYAQESKQNNQVDTETKLLEFSYPAYSENVAFADIENNNPPIIKINMEPDRAGYHFLVGSAKTNDNQIIINDPIQLTGEQKTIPDVYPENALVSLARFIPSNTDLSYFWFETTPTTRVLLANENESLIDAIYHDTGSILDPETDQVSPPSNLVGYQKPTAGKYFLSLDSDVDGIVPLFYGLYGQNADSTSGTISLFVDNESQRNIIIDYDKTIINQSQLMVLSTHKTLYNLIRYLSNEGKIPNKLSRHFTHLVDQSQKVSSANGYGHGQTAILHALIQQISNAYGEQKISKETTDMLIQEITWLLSSIDDIKE